MAKSFDPLEALDRIKNNYRTYVSSFQKFKNPAIREWIDERIDEGTLLYKGPYIQINRRFSLGDSFDKLIEDGNRKGSVSFANQHRRPEISQRSHKNKQTTGQQRGCNKGNDDNEKTSYSGASQIFTGFQ